MQMKKQSKNYLENVFEKNSEYKFESDAEGQVTIFVENKGLFNKIAQTLLKKPKVSQVHLEKFGSFVWNQVDGERDVVAIGKLVEEHFGDEAKPVYERLSVYMKNLENMDFIKKI